MKKLAAEYKLISLPIIVASVAAVALRWYLFFKPGYAFDLGQFIKWTKFILDNGFFSLYSAENIKIVDNYPPVIPLLTSFWFKISPIFHLGFSDIQNTKFIFTIVEIILVGVISAIIIRSNAKHKVSLLALTIISPALALVTTGWGQAEAVFVLLILLAFVLIEKMTFMSVVFLLLALLTKPQAIPAVGIYFLYLFFKDGFKKAIIYFGVFLAMFAAAYLIFYSIGKISLIELFTGSVGFYKNLSLNAFNFWWVIYGRGTWDIVDKAAGQFNYKTVGLTMFVIFELPALYYLSKAKKISEVALVLGYTYLCFFVFPTQIHERYLYPAVAFLGVAAALDKQLFYAYILVSVTFILNILAVLQSVYPQFGFLSQSLIAGSWTTLVAGANVLLCLYLAMYLISKSYAKS
jgi:Gpi18-like mannosyltransferase